MDGSHSRAPYWSKLQRLVRSAGALALMVHSGAACDMTCADPHTCTGGPTCVPAVKAPPGIPAGFTLKYEGCFIDHDTHAKGDAKGTREW